MLTAEPETAETYQDSQRGNRLHPRRWHRLYWHLTCLRSELQEIQQNYLKGSGGALIDFGCGNMPYRPVLQVDLRSYSGADLAGNPQADLIVNRHGRIQLVDDGAVDFVLSNQVLEHVPDPIAYLQEARRVLAESGLLILSTHGVWRYHPDPTDYWRWTGAGLEVQLKRCGFDVIQRRGIMGPPSYALQILQDAFAEILPGISKPVFYFCMQYLIQWADWCCPDNVRHDDASVYVIVARKSCEGSTSVADSSL